MELTTEQALQQGVTAHQEGKLQDAERLYRAILQSQPAHPDANHNLGLIAVSVNKTDVAVPLFKTALEANPKIEQFWLSYIDALIKEKQFDNAKQVIQQGKQRGMGGERLNSLEAQLSPKIQKPNTASVSPPQELLNSLIGHYQNRRLSDAEKLAISITQEFPKHEFGWKVLGAVLGQTGRKSEAVDVNQKAISLSPQDAAAHSNLGSTLQELGRLDEAEASCRQAIALKPDYAEAHSNLGSTLKKLGRLDDAEASYNRAIALKPEFAEAHYNLGNTLKELGRLDEAESSCRQAIALKPDFAEAHSNFGATLQELGRLDEAEASCRHAIALKPDYVGAHYNLGITLQELGRLDEAEASCRQAIALKRDYAEAHNNLGNTLKELGRLDEAEASYKQAIALKSDFAEAHSNLGATLKELGRLDKAEASCRQAIALKPDYAEAHSNFGATLQKLGRLDEAIAAYNKALSIKPDYPASRAQCLHYTAHICDWSAIEDNHGYLPELGEKGEAVSPFSLLSLEDAPGRHRLRSVNFAREKYPQKATALWAKPSEKPERLRIGYFSADFHNHAVMYLIAQIFAAHDKSRFEIFAYSYGPDRQDEMRKKLLSAVNVFHDVREMNDMQIVELSRAEKVDIAIDLMGFTNSTRLEPFAYGLAPVQISYLGYPGTLGADFIDYIVADPVVIPDEKRQYYSEKVIYLPNTYQPTDNTRVISDKIITREDMGLPINGFVFCCFNNNYKISPREFDIWMRLLGRVESSVLWLLKSNKWAEQNLKRAAESRGISAERLVFAEKVPQAEHLARQKLADLFLDTFNYNAHTTASDALWAGLPVVTKLGEGFAARVAGSLLTAIELPELITKSEEAYEALALTLATDPKQLGQIKSELDRNRLTQPLFDSEMYTRHLEAGYHMAYDRYFNEQERRDIVVPKYANTGKTKENRNMLNARIP